MHVDNDNSFQGDKVNKYNTSFPPFTQYLRILTFENYQCVFSEVIAMCRVTIKTRNFVAFHN